MCSRQLASAPSMGGGGGGRNDDCVPCGAPYKVAEEMGPLFAGSLYLRGHYTCLAMLVSRWAGCIPVDRYRSGQNLPNAGPTFWPIPQSLAKYCPFWHDVGEVRHKSAKIGRTGAHCRLSEFCVGNCRTAVRQLFSPGSPKVPFRGVWLAALRNTYSRCL